MIGSGEAEKPEQQNTIRPILELFRLTAGRIALRAAEWRDSLLRWWRHAALQLTADPRPPSSKKKKKDKSKAKGKAGNPFLPKF